MLDIFNRSFMLRNDMFMRLGTHSADKHGHIWVQPFQESNPEFKIILGKFAPIKMVHPHGGLVFGLEGYFFQHLEDTHTTYVTTYSWNFCLNTRQNEVLLAQMEALQAVKDECDERSKILSDKITNFDFPALDTQLTQGLFKGRD